MTEAEWLTTTNPSYALDFARVSLSESADAERGMNPLERKDLLFTVACCRRIWRLIPDDGARRCVEVAERFADNQATVEELQAAARKAGDLVWQTDQTSAFLALKACAATCGRGDCDRIQRDTSGAARFEQRAAGEDESVISSRVEEADLQLIREIFGNPFRPIAFSHSWRISAVVALASQMYESRDFSAMPILADALQDAGCDSADVLGHCRGEGPHVRGCWVVDLVLGKE